MKIRRRKKKYRHNPFNLSKSTSHSTHEYHVENLIPSLKSGRRIFTGEREREIPEALEAPDAQRDLRIKGIAVVAKAIWRPRATRWQEVASSSRERERERSFRISFRRLLSKSKKEILDSLAAKMLMYEGSMILYPFFVLTFILTKCSFLLLSLKRLVSFSLSRQFIHPFSPFE